MSMISIQGFSQLVPSGAVAVAEESSAALEQVLTVLAESDDRVAIGAQKTAQQFEQFMAQMQKRFAMLSEENCKLREQLIASDSRQRELEVLHRTEIQALTDKVSSGETAVETMRQEMVASARSADARVAAAVIAQAEAVKTVAQAGDARVATAIQTGDTRVATAIQTGDTRVATAIQTGDTRVAGARSALQQVVECMKRTDAYFVNQSADMYSGQTIAGWTSHNTRQLQSTITNCVV